MILMVRSGRITACEAAQRLGVSRKTYYEWEQKGLQAMLESLENKSPGRPRQERTDPEVLRLRGKVRQLETRLEVMEEIQDLRDLIRDVKNPLPPSGTASRRPGKIRKKKR